MKLKITIFCLALSMTTSVFAANAKKKPAAKAATTAAPAEPMSHEMNHDMDNMSDSRSPQYGMAGCGLGSMLFGTKPGIIQIFATTTNGTFGNQTFAITTGTLNCKPDTTLRSAELFITVNKDSLAKDVSRGNGEAINNLSQIVGCKDSNEFGAKLQQNYQSIFPNNNVNTAEVSNKIMNIIHNDKQLAQSCAHSG